MDGRLQFIYLLLSICQLVTTSVMHIATGNNEFAFNLFPILSEERKNGNLFISPISITSCIGTMYMMSIGNGAEEIAKVMHFDSNKTNTAQAFQDALQALHNGNFNFANGIFLSNNRKINDSFMELVEKYFGSKLENLNFAKEPEKSREFINDWVAATTKGMIKDLMPSGSINYDTQIAMASALHFKGEWEISFNPRMTRQQNFALADGSSKKVDMMLGTLKNVGYNLNKNLNAKILRIPYKASKQSMVIILPLAGTSLDQVIRNLSRLNFGEDVISKLQSNIELTVMFPKFRLNDYMDLLHPLKKMGIDLNASMHVTGVYHRTAIVVDENGTEAAAATGAGVNSDPFLANRPFLFAIVDTRTKSIIFLGRFSDP